MNFLRLSLSFALLLPLLGLTGCAIAGTSLQDAAAEINATYSVDPQVLDVGDSVMVNFASNADWNQRVKVKSDGYANLRFLGEVELKGLSERELVEELTSAYEATLQDADVEVRVADWAPRNCFVAGEVRTRGTVAITGQRMSLVEALVRSGGHQWRTAQLRRIHFIRWIPEEARYRRWLLDARVNEWEADPIFLQPYDIVYVPPTVITRVNNWMDVYVRRNIPLPILFNRASNSL